MLYDVNDHDGYWLVYDLILIKDEFKTTFSDFNEPFTNYLENLGLPTEGILAPISERQIIINSIENEIEDQYSIEYLIQSNKFHNKKVAIYCDNLENFSKIFDQLINEQCYISIRDYDILTYDAFFNKKEKICIIVPTGDSLKFDFMDYEEAYKQGYLILEYKDIILK